MELLPANRASARLTVAQDAALPDAAQPAAARQDAALRSDEFAPRPLGACLAVRRDDPAQIGTDVRAVLVLVPATEPMVVARLALLLSEPMALRRPDELPRARQAVRGAAPQVHRVEMVSQERRVALVLLPELPERPWLPLPQVTQLETRAFPEPGVQPVLSHLAWS